MLSVDASAYFIPETRLRVMENLQRFNLTAAEAKVYAKFYGLEEIPYAEDLATADLVLYSIKALLDKTQIQLKDVKYLIHAHTAKVITRFGRSIVCELKDKLKLQHAIAFGTSMNNCASTLNAFEMAKQLLQQEDRNAKAIVVVGERAFTPTVQVIPNTSITADASAAVLLSLSAKQSCLLHLEMHTAGQYSQGVWLSVEASRDFEKQYVILLSRTILRAVSKAGLTLNDIKIILPHNVNLISWANTAKYIDYPLSKIYLENVRKYAHCFGADIIINYVDALKAGRLKRGDYYLMVTVGLGATFAAAVFQSRAASAPGPHHFQIQPASSRPPRTDQALARARGPDA